ncbi:benzoate/H(+) symporter BenE family transporter [Pantoea sp. BIGb0393]|uniref:Benzoate/H(+) symporter BenE family transporter n=1 Tax=Pantoea nemavictus TaxID=2726955 RepID=A0ABU8PWV1_9GAMM|nr:benzoate/H(+) symporter BenE family transporter [Pantoea nemavictus]MBA0038216.1 benzoate/H(+) symporter BenE family transporter [Pantoea nemavictus]
MMTASTRSAFSFPMLISGFVAVLIGYSSSAALIFQAAQAAGASPEQIGGWLSMLGIGMGLASLGLSLWTRMPILAAWSTPGAALLATSVQGLTLNEVVGVFVATNLLIVLCGVTGLFARLMNHIPQSLAAAMLAGILLRFGIGTFSGLQSHFALCGSMCLVWLISRRWLPRYAIILALIAGVLVAFYQQTLHLPPHALAISRPEFIMPQFNLAALIGVGLPYFLVTMASQNAPGIATLQAHGYQPPISALTGWTGFLALILSPFGGFSVCIAAITAAICMGEEVDANPARRWMASALAGVFYLLTGFTGGLIAVLLSALPPVFIATLAGLALLGTLAGSLQRALAEPAQRDSAIVAFLITASGISLLGIGSAFWGLLGGMLTFLILSPRSRA